MDDLHLEADLFFGPCNDPDCPGGRLSSTPDPRVDLGWAQDEQLRLIRGEDHPPMPTGDT